MNNIGQRIKELRRKNDLTQEKLADFLGVTYQSVSKWETGITYPDLSMIGPLTRLLHISSDELLGLNDATQDERKAFFDAEYHEYWKKDDHEADYLLAKQAVEEYPGDFRYLHWLGSVEYYISFNRPGQEEFLAMMDSSIKHNLMVWEGSADNELRNNALWTVICAYRYSGRTAEAKKYAKIYPENAQTGRDDAMELCLEGEELRTLQQKMVVDALAKLCGNLGKIWALGDPADPRVRACAQAEKAIIEAIIPDGNFLEFSIYLSGIHKKLADIALDAGDPDAAIRELEQAFRFAAESDKARISGKQLYTCPILDRYVYDYSDCRQYGSEVDMLKERLREDKWYDPLRDRQDFQALIR